MPLAEIVLNGTLLGSGRLREGGGATEGASKGSVLHAHNADIGGTSCGTSAGHALGHLDLCGL
jgi:hypothetical protein